MKISMEYLLEIVDKIRKGPVRQISHLLLYPDDFVEMMRQDALLDNVDRLWHHHYICGDVSHDRPSMSYFEILGRGLCICGLPIRTSGHVEPGKVFEVVEI